jgi:hypothetical protein
MLCPNNQCCQCKAQFNKWLLNKSTCKLL